MPDIGGIPVFVNDLLPRGSIMLIGKSTRRPWVVVDSLDTMREALDAEFLRTCGIITGVSIG